MKALLEAGVHFGHQTRRWNPKMRKFIFSERNGIHIIDLQQTVDRLEAACDFVSDMVSNGGTILFVGTKRQAQETIEAEAKRCGMPYVTTRWLGGTLTNFATIQGRIDYPIPSNDDAIRAIKLITARIADVVLEGLTAREYVQQAALEAEDVDVKAYSETGYIASPDEPYPSEVEAQAEAEPEDMAGADRAEPPASSNEAEPGAAEPVAEHAETTNTSENG